MVSKIKIILICGLLILSSCGIHVSGGLNININMDILKQYFQEYCAEKYPQDLELQKRCIDFEVARFLDMLMNGNK